MFFDAERHGVRFSASSAPIGKPDLKSHDNDRLLCTTHQTPLVLGIPFPSSRMGDTWYFAGLNANGVIPIGSQQGGHPDIRRFMPIPELTPDLDEDVDVVFACFSQVVCK